MKKHLTKNERITFIIIYLVLAAIITLNFMAVFKKNPINSKFTISNNQVVSPPKISTFEIGYYDLGYLYSYTSAVAYSKQTIITIDNDYDLKIDIIANTIINKNTVIATNGSNNIVATDTLRIYEVYYYSDHLELVCYALEDSLLNVQLAYFDILENDDQVSLDSELYFRIFYTTNLDKNGVLIPSNQTRTVEVNYTNYQFTMDSYDNYNIQITGLDTSFFNGFILNIEITTIQKFNTLGILAECFEYYYHVNNILHGVARAVEIVDNIVLHYPIDFELEGKYGNYYEISEKYLDNYLGTILYL